MVDSIEKRELELAGIAAEIDALCDAKFQSGGSYYLLSALGVDLGETLKRLKALTGISLAQFIRTHLSQKIDVVRMGSHNNILAAIPLAGPLPIISETGLDKAGAEKRPRLHYRFWAAFAKPLTNAQRFLDVEKLTFVDVGTDKTPEEGLLVITNQMIPASDLPNRDDRIWQNVEQWITENKFSIDRFIAPAPMLSARFQVSGGVSVLEAMIGALDRRQLQSTQMSLDIIAALLQTRSR